MKMLELFSGSKQMSQTFKEHGWQVTSIDCCAEYDPDIIADIGQLAADDLDRYDVIWSSPPCEQFSIANHFRSWTPDRKPRSQKTIDAVRLHQHALRLIEQLNPKYYFIENPRGLLRKMPWMKPYRRYTLTYCQYGSRVQKPTDIWTNHPNPGFKRPCEPGASCHISSPSGSSLGLAKRSNFKNAHERSVIPQQLCEHIVQICEQDYTLKSMRQMVLTDVS
jgi:hypothetical protein